MSKTLWHTISIKVPSEMVELTKTGKISIKRTLTKLNNISKSQKMPSIKLIPSNINKPEIINEGKEWNVEELKTRMKKANELANKNKGKVLTKNSGLKMKEFKSKIQSTVETIREKNKRMKEAEDALKKMEESNKGLSFSQGITKMKQNIEKQNIINFINKFKPLLIDESTDNLSDEKIIIALSQLYRLRNRTDNRGQSNLTDKDIENWGSKYGLTYKTGRTGVKTSKEFITKQKKIYIEDIKKKFFTREEEEDLKIKPVIKSPIVSQKEPKEEEPNQLTEEEARKKYKESDKPLREVFKDSEKIKQKMLEKYKKYDKDSLGQAVVELERDEYNRKVKERYKKTGGGFNQDKGKKLTFKKIVDIIFENNLSQIDVDKRYMNELQKVINHYTKEMEEYNVNDKGFKFNFNQVRSYKRKLADMAIKYGIF
jgi:hypothetical protein